MKKFLEKSGGAIFTLALILGAFFLGIEEGKNRIPPEKIVSGVDQMESTYLMKPSLDFSPFWKVWSLIDEKFVTTGSSTIDAEKRLWGAISGMVDSLGDPHTLFLPPTESKMFATEISGSFEGIGMEISSKDGSLTVVAPLKNSPAEKAGILPGDIIVKINDTPSINMKSEEAVKLIRGKKGTPVKLFVSRKNVKEPLEINVIRDTIVVPTIETEYKGTISQNDSGGESPDPMRGGAFIIRLYSFSAPSASQFRDALRAFVESGSNRLIIDLRGNPGGFLDSAVDIASWFIPIGEEIVREDFGSGKDERVYRSRGFGGNIFKNVKIAILVDEGSASASEILAGAMQEYGLAKLVGTKTFGKGSVQELIEVTPETSVKITIARWLTPKGKSISDGGLMPDYEVKITDKDRDNKKDPQLDKAIEILR